MGEARTRPARDAQRFQQIIRAELWFWSKMRDTDDLCWEVIGQWRDLPQSVRIRRWRAAQPQESEDVGDDCTSNPDQDAADARAPKLFPRETTVHDR